MKNAFILKAAHRAYRVVDLKFPIDICRAAEVKKSGVDNQINALDKDKKRSKNFKGIREQSKTMKQDRKK